MNTTEFTAENLENLQAIHTRNFKTAVKKITKHQDRYTKDYDQRKRTRNSSLKSGDKVQKEYRTVTARWGRKMENAWRPIGAYYLVSKINKRKSVVYLKNPRTGRNFKRSYPLSQIRKCRNQ